VSVNIVLVDEESLRKDIRNLVRRTVEEKLDALVDENASDLVGASRLGAGALKAPAFFALWNGVNMRRCHMYALLWANKGYR